VAKYPVQYIAGGATQNSVRVAQWVSGAAPGWAAIVGSVGDDAFGAQLRAAAEKDGVMVPALAAGGHFDPKETKQHGEPWGDGHLGDLPPLTVATDGTSVSPVHAPRLRLSDVRHRSLMVHAGGDNHSDHPMPLGGGGARVACGVIDR
jgi:Cu/Zn superoxide dismutase